MPSSDPNVELEARAVELRERASTLAGPLHAAARASTTPACERAVLRLLGVGGLDGQGRPLAQEVIDRFAALGPARLGGGISLPFAAAAREYDLDPQELALEVAAGHVDLGLEAEVLRDPDRRAAAEATAREWLLAGWRRFAAQRTARGELRSLLGDPGPTLLGAELGMPEAGAAALQVEALVALGAHLVLARVPRDRELRRGLGEQLDPPDTSDDLRRAPTGSQRGLGLLRATLDRAAAEAGHYAALASHSLGLAAPDQAVVAGLERVDVVFSDPLEPVFEFGLSPERSVADHAFALEVHARSGTEVVLGPGPLAVAPEMVRGQPITPAAQAGRALALQALAVELTRCGSLPPERIHLQVGLEGGPDQRDAQVRGLAAVHLRRAVFPEHRAVFVEGGASDLVGWPLVLQTALAGGDPPAIVLRGPIVGTIPPSLIDGAAGAVSGAATFAAARHLGGLHGEALVHARATLDEALLALRTIAGEGWDWLVSWESAVGRGDGERILRRRIDAAAPVPRREALDPFAVPPELGAVAG